MDLCPISTKKLQSIVNERRKLVSTVEDVTRTIEAFGDSMRLLNVTSAMMMNLLQDLLDLGQIEKKSFQLNNEYFDLIQTIEQAFMISSGTAELKDVKLVKPEITDKARA